MMKVGWLVPLQIALGACAATVTAEPTRTPVPPTRAPTEVPTQTPIPQPEIFRYHAFHGSGAHADWDRAVFREWADTNLEMDTERHAHDFYSGVVPTSQINSAMNMAVMKSMNPYFSQ